MPLRTLGCFFFLFSATLAGLEHDVERLTSDVEAATAAVNEVGGRVPCAYACGRVEMRSSADPVLARAWRSLQARLAKATAEADFEMLSVIEVAAKRASEATDRIRRLDDDLARMRRDVRERPRPPWNPNARCLLTQPHACNSKKKIHRRPYRRRT